MLRGFLPHSPFPLKLGMEIPTVAMSIVTVTAGDAVVAKGMITHRYG